MSQNIRMPGKNQSIAGALEKAFLESILEQIGERHAHIRKPEEWPLSYVPH